MVQITYYFDKKCPPCADQKKELKKLGKGFKVKNIDINKSSNKNVRAIPTLFIKGKNRTAKIEGLTKASRIKKLAKEL